MTVLPELLPLGRGAVSTEQGRRGAGANPAERLDRVAEDLIARGCVENHDFFTTGRDPHARPPSELVGLRFHEGRHQVRYRDMGSGASSPSRPTSRRSGRPSSTTSTCWPAATGVARVDRPVRRVRRGVHRGQEPAGHLVLAGPEHPSTGLGALQHVRTTGLVAGHRWRTDLGPADEVVVTHHVVGDDVVATLGLTGDRHDR